MRFHFWQTYPLIVGLLTACTGLDGTSIEGSADNKVFLSNEVRAYLDVLKEDSNYTAAYLGLGWSFLHDRKYELAVQNFEKALKVQPRTTVAYLGLGIAYEKLKKFTDARTAYSEVLSRQPNWYLAHYQLGRLNIMEQKKEEAMENVQLLVSHNKALADKLIDEIYQ